MDNPTALQDTEVALRPFLDALREANAATVRPIVQKILAHPEIFCGFDQIKEIVGDRTDPQLTATLDLFSYGTVKDYTSKPSTFMSLNDRQMQKLQQLTVLSVVQLACSSGTLAIEYESAGEALGLEAGNKEQRRSLEQIIISCLYARVLNGRLCQKSRRFLLTAVPPCISRDVPMTSLGGILAGLGALQARIEASQNGLQCAHTSVSQQLQQSTNFWKSVQDRRAKAHTQATTGGTGSASSGGTVRLAGWPEGGGTVAARRSSASRQSKRSRGGVGGPFPEPYERY